MGALFLPPCCSEYTKNGKREEVEEEREREDRKDEKKTRRQTKSLFALILFFPSIFYISLIMMSGRTLVAALAAAVLLAGAGK